MKCPYCNGEMEKGSIQSRNTSIIWDKKRHHLALKPISDGMELAFSMGITSIDNVYCCKRCKKMIFNYD